MQNRKIKRIKQPNYHKLYLEKNTELNNLRFIHEKDIKDIEQKHIENLERQKLLAQIDIIKHSAQALEAIARAIMYTTGQR